MIWKLPEFELIDFLMVPVEPGYYSTEVILYNDYILCSADDSTIAVWKTSLDNLEHQLHFFFNFKFQLHEFEGICVLNDIICGEYGV